MLKPWSTNWRTRRRNRPNLTPITAAPQINGSSTDGTRKAKGRRSIHVRFPAAMVTGVASVARMPSALIAIPCAREASASRAVTFSAALRPGTRTETIASMGRADSAFARNTFHVPGAPKRTTPELNRSSTEPTIVSDTPPTTWSSSPAAQRRPASVSAISPGARGILPASSRYRPGKGSAAQSVSR